MDVSQLNDEDIERIQKLYRMFKSPNNEHEADNARRKLETLLRRLGLEWCDLDEVMKIDLENRIEDENVLLLVEGLISKYVWMSQEERLAVALWILHTHVFTQYNITPRLAAVSPVFGCGKTTLLTLIQQLAFNPTARYNNLTPALIFRLIDSKGPATLFIDEANNLNILQDGTLRAVLNSNRRGDVIGRAAAKQGTHNYWTHTPIVIASKGRLPNDLMQRCVIINMQRYPADVQLDELHEYEPQFNFAMKLLREVVENWARNCKLDWNPKNPLRGRRADNWRSLFAIADSFGRGREARVAALKLNAGLPDDDYKVFLLEDIRDVFDVLDTDRIWTSVLLDKLYTLGTGMWLEWCGENDDRPPHKLTPTELARMLRDFPIKPRTVFQTGPRKSRGPSASGYYRQDFETAWASYCTPHTPTHPHTVHRIAGSSE